MERARCSEKVIRGLEMAFALVTASAITAGNDLGAAQHWLQGMRAWYSTPKAKRGRKTVRARR